MNAQGQLLESYTRGVGLAGDIGTIVAVTHHAGSGVTPGTYYAHHNHRGDVIITRSATTTVGVYEYSAFGNLKSSIANDLCRFKLSSKELDRATGFYYYGYRFYAPQWQRWVSRDPIGENGGANVYGFCRNSPVVYIDPVGKKMTGADCYAWYNSCVADALTGLKDCLGPFAAPAGAGVVACLFGCLKWAATPQIYGGCVALCFGADAAIGLISSTTCWSAYFDAMKGCNSKLCMCLSRVKQ